MNQPPMAGRVPVVANNTVKLPTALRSRVANAMLAGGFSVWAEFCRVALTEKCQSTEKTLRVTDPAMFAQIYGVNHPVIV